MSVADSQDVVMVAGVFFLVGFLLCFFCILFLARYKLEYMESFLKSAKWITLVESDFGIDGWFSRMYRLNVLGIVLCFPELMARRGEIKLEELYAIPRNLRFSLICAQSLQCGFFVLFAATTMLIERIA